MFEALLPWVTYPDANSKKGRGKRGKFREAPRSQSERAVAEIIPDVPSAGFCSPEMIRNVETGRAEVEALLNAAKTTASQVGVRREGAVSARQTEFGAVAESHARYRDLLHDWLGAERRNDPYRRRGPHFEPRRSCSWP